MYFFLLYTGVFLYLYVCLLSNLSYRFSLPHRALCKGTKSSNKPSREEDADVAALLQQTQSALEQLQSEVQCCCGIKGAFIWNRLTVLNEYKLKSNFLNVLWNSNYYNAQDPIDMATHA